MGEKMVFRIHYGFINESTNCFYNEDSIVVEGESIDEIRELAHNAISERGAVGIYSEEL